jgi:hypothetical protein
MATATNANLLRGIELLAHGGASRQGSEVTGWLQPDRALLTMGTEGF